MGTSKANAQWTGTLEQGQGSMHPAHAGEIPFSFGSRFEGQEKSNPEEVVGAALAGCFSMALALSLEKEGLEPIDIETTADVKLDKVGDGFAVTSIELRTQVKAKGDLKDLAKIAETTKQNCPIGKALSAVPITLQVSS